MGKSSSPSRAPESSSFWQELNIVLEGLDARHFPQQIKLRRNLPGP